MKTIIIPEVTEKPPMEDLAALAAFYVGILTRLGVGLLEAELTTSSGPHVPWHFHSFVAGDRIRPDLSHPRVVDTLEAGFFRPVLARLGGIFIGDMGLYGGSDMFQVQFDHQTEPLPQHFRIYTANLSEVGLWTRIYRYK